ncbi:MAG: 50S ribosomal protein L11 methyltransferase, partial [Pseudomonadota bacterium]
GRCNERSMHKGRREGPAIVAGGGVPVSAAVAAAVDGAGCIGRLTGRARPGRGHPDPTACNIMLDPGLAFGSGTHATTALCLEWLALHDISNKVVLDYGCGSGILAIAAAKLGASQVWAVDHDAQALQATRENAKNNQVNVETLFPSQLPDMEADILIANILAQPLIELSEKLAASVKIDGNIVLSGILENQSNKVKASYTSVFDLEPITIREEWVRLSGRKAQNP